eukprot:jgi/Mesvir1/22650/Mv14085-RA.1
MACNKDEAERCVEIATQRLAASDHEGAQKFFEKAKRMWAELPSLNYLQAIIEVTIAGKAHPGSGFIDWYKVLQVHPAADESKVKKQYRQLALILHPDKNRLAGAEEAFKLIGQAQQVLTNAAARAAHDRVRHCVAVQSAQPAATPATAAPTSHGPPSSSHFTFHPSVPHGMYMPDYSFAPGVGYPGAYTAPPQYRPSPPVPPPPLTTACTLCGHKHLVPDPSMIHRQACCALCNRVFVISLERDDVLRWTMEFRQREAVAAAVFAQQQQQQQQWLHRQNAYHEQPRQTRRQQQQQQQQRFSVPPAAAAAASAAYASAAYSHAVNGHGWMPGMASAASPGKAAAARPVPSKPHGEDGGVAGKSEGGMTGAKRKKGPGKAEGREATAAAAAPAASWVPPSKARSSDASRTKRPPPPKKRRNVQVIMDSEEELESSSEEDTEEEEEDDDVVIVGARSSKKSSSHGKGEQGRGVAEPSRGVSTKGSGSASTRGMREVPLRRSRLKQVNYCEIGDSDNDFMEGDEGDQAMKNARGKGGSRSGGDVKRSSQSSGARAASGGTTRVAGDAEREASVSEVDAPDASLGASRCPRDADASRQQRKERDKDVEREEEEEEEEEEEDEDDEDEDARKAAAEKAFVTLDPDFHDFDATRRPEDIEPGEVWAMYDEEGLPRFYTVIDQVRRTPSFKVWQTWLEADDPQGATVCGRFRAGTRGCQTSIAVFSQKVPGATVVRVPADTAGITSGMSRKGPRIQAVWVTPLVGETWALYPPPGEEVTLGSVPAQAAPAAADSPVFHQKVVVRKLEFIPSSATDQPGGAGSGQQARMDGASQGATAAYDVQGTLPSTESSCGLTSMHTAKEGTGGSTSGWDASTTVVATVVPLRKCERFCSLFVPVLDDAGKEVELVLRGLSRLSHRIPSFSMKGKEGEGVPKGALELDPSAYL